VVKSAGSDTSPHDRSDLVLDVLETLPDEVTVGELAAVVSRVEEVTACYEVVHEDLFRRVLPSLEERGELRFDVDRGIVICDSDDGVTLLDRLRDRLPK
jgi:hypothetical protein